MDEPPIAPIEHPRGHLEGLHIGPSHTAVDERHIRHLDGEVGARRLVLTETNNSGRSEHFTPVRFDRPVEPGILVEAEVAGHDGRRLIAA